MKIIRSHWFSDPGSPRPIGIVIADTAEGRRAYIGTGEGRDTKTDEAHVLACGTVVPRVVVYSRLARLDTHHILTRPLRTRTVYYCTYATGPEDIERTEAWRTRTEARAEAKRLCALGYGVMVEKHHEYTRLVRATGTLISLIRTRLRFWTGIIADTSMSGRGCAIIRLHRW
jgi:hypothetical protein